MASDTRPQIDIMVGHRRRRHWCRLRCQNLRFGFDENRKTFHPFNRVRANVWQRRIYRFISANSASRNTCRILAHSKWRTLAHSHTHTRTDNLAISAKPYYTEISRHGETTDCVNGKCHSLHSHFKIWYASAALRPLRPLRDKL